MWRPTGSQPVIARLEHVCRDEASTGAASASAAHRHAEEADLIDAIAEGRHNVPLSTRPDVASHSSPSQPPAQQPSPAQRSGPVQQPAPSQATAEGDTQKPKVELHMSTAVSVPPIERAVRGCAMCSSTL